MGSALAALTCPPQVEAVRAARRFVQAQLAGAGWDQLAEDAGLLASELAANAVLHARTDFDVVLYAVSGGVRVEVRDRSGVLPVFTAPSATAMSGRGLVLVQTLAVRWGSQVCPEGGKQVWFEMAEVPAVVEVDLGVEDLLAMWADFDGAAAGPPSPGGASDGGAREGVGGLEVVIADLPARELLGAKEHMDDLLRELQLVLLGSNDWEEGPGDGAGRAAQEAREVAVARQLDAAARAFEVVRRQVREQVSRAVVGGQDRVTLHLQLPAGVGGAAVAYAQAVLVAEELADTGSLLTRTDGLQRHRVVRRAYLEEIITAADRR